MCFPLSALPKVKYFCCCIPIRTGTIIIGVVQCLVIFDVLAYMLGDDTALDVGDEKSARDQNRGLEVFVCLIIFVLGVMLLVGVFKRMPNLIRIYMWAFLSFKIVILVLIMFILLLDLILGLGLLIVFIVHSFFLLTVNTFYLQLSEEMHQSEPLQSQEMSKEMVP